LIIINIKKVNDFVNDDIDDNGDNDDNDDIDDNDDNDNEKYITSFVLL